MAEPDVIQDWTESEVPMKYGPSRHVRYRIYRQGDKLFQEIRDVDDRSIHTFELPSGLALEKKQLRSPVALRAGRRGEFLSTGYLARIYHPFAAKELARARAIGDISGPGSPGKDDEGQGRPFFLHVDYWSIRFNRELWRRTRTAGPVPSNSKTQGSRRSSSSVKRVN